MVVVPDTPAFARENVCTFVNVTSEFPAALRTEIVKVLVAVSSSKEVKSGATKVFAGLPFSVEVLPVDPAFV